MPRKRRTPKICALQGLNRERIEHLIKGSVHAGNQFPFDDEEHRHQLWEENREYLMSLRGDPDSIDYWGETTLYLPATRPAGWWDYEAPEPRRLLRGSVLVICGDGDRFLFVPGNHSEVDRKFWHWHGRPDRFWPSHEPPRVLKVTDPQPVTEVVHENEILMWESQICYLERLGFLEAGEKDAAVTLARAHWHQMKEKFNTITIEPDLSECPGSEQLLCRWGE
ncbi:hypothetical protein MYX75_02040 [Acidobacteria bacterium AH-259-A15]|nr:hypothetical protein [Acidobacteria bacterium AH-259-A15]